MKIHQRRHLSFLPVLPILLGAVFLAASPSAASAQIERLRIIAPASPGGGWDQTARSIQQVMEEEDLATNIQVNNIPGAGGTIGLAQFATNYEGLGNALLISGLVMEGAVLINNSPVSLEDVTPIARLTGEYEVIVVPSESDIYTLDQLIARFKEDPRSISWAGGSAGGTDHILVGLIAQEVGVAADGINYIPYSGGGEALAALLGNHVSAGVSGVAEFAGQIVAGQLRPIAVSSPERIEGLDAPTLVEKGIAVELVNWRGVVAPPAISAQDRQRLLDAVDAMVSSQEWLDILQLRGWMNAYLPGEEFEAFLENDQEKVASTLREIGLIE